MDIVFLLVPLSLVLILAIGGVLSWAIFRGQFDDLSEQGSRILGDDDFSR